MRTSMQGSDLLHFNVPNGHKETATICFRAPFQVSNAVLAGTGIFCRICFYFTFTKILS